MNLQPPWRMFPAVQYCVCSENFSLRKGKRNMNGKGTPPGVSHLALMKEYLHYHLMKNLNEWKMLILLVQHLLMQLRSEFMLLLMRLRTSMTTKSWQLCLMIQIYLSTMLQGGLQMLSLEGKCWMESILSSLRNALSCPQTSPWHMTW